MILSIRDWGKHFESAESRKLKSLKWVAMPNRMNTMGYTALLDHPNGAAHFGAWCAIVEICSSREPRELRGTLPEADGTIGGISRALGRISRLPSGIFEEVLPRLIGESEIQWIQSDTGTSGESAGVPGDAAAIPVIHRRGLQGITGEGNNNPQPPFPPEGEFALEPTTGVPSPPPPQQGVVLLPPVSPTRKRSARGDRRTTEEIKRGLGERLEWWDAFWATYPCKEGMKEGLLAFERIATTRELALEIYHGAKRYAAKCAADPSVAVKYPQGWLNAERWKDPCIARAPTVAPPRLNAAGRLIERIRAEEAAAKSNGTK